MNVHRTLKDLAIALGLLVGWLGLAFLGADASKKCNNKCPVDKKCVQLCQKRQDCPHWDGR